MKKKIKSCFVFSLLAIAFFFSESSPQKIVIACAGDSLMRPVPLYLRRLLPAKHIVIKEWAQGGLSSATYLSFFLAHQNWRQKKVDIILFQLGTNDVSLFLRNEEDEENLLSNLRRIIKEFKKIKSNYFHHPRIILATAPPFAGVKDEAEKNRLLDEVVNPVIRRLANEEKLLLIDHWSRFKGRPDLYDQDGVHPSGEGEKLIARSWRRAIRILWLSYKVRSYKKITKIA